MKVAAQGSARFYHIEIALLNLGSLKFFQLGSRRKGRVSAEAKSQ